MEDGGLALYKFCIQPRVLYPAKPLVKCKRRKERPSRTRKKIYPPCNISLEIPRPCALTK